MDFNPPSDAIVHHVRQKIDVLIVCLSLLQSMAELVYSMPLHDLTFDGARDPHRFIVDEVQKTPRLGKC
jgi:hypothetical protein